MGKGEVADNHGTQELLLKSELSPHFEVVRDYVGHLAGHCRDLRLVEQHAPFHSLDGKSKYRGRIGALT